MTKYLTWLKSNRALAILLVAFCALAVFYSVIIPIFEGPDEDDHFRYVKFIADQRALPVQVFQTGGGIAGHQGWQPPLYYSLAALLISPIDTSDHEQHLWRNYAATFLGDPACCGRNIYYHTDSENFPFTRTTLAVHLARLLSILFGAIAVGAMYAMAKTMLASWNYELRIANCELGVPLAAAAFVAFNPSFLFASALVSNDAPLAALTTLVLLMWVKLLTRESALTLKSASILGGLIGIALLIKTTAVGLILFTLLIFGFIAFRQRTIRLFVLTSLAALIVITFVAGWWFIRNTLLYGDPLAYRLMTTTAIFPRDGPLTLPELFQISLPWLWQTFWGGPTPGDFSSGLLVLLAVACAIVLVGAVIFAIRIANYELRIALGFLAAWLGFIFIAQIQFIQTTIGADQGRYLFPAIGAIALFFALGLHTFTFYVSRFTFHAPRTTHHSSHLPFVISSFIICSLFALALFVPFAYTLPAYARPALVSENDLARVSHPMQTNFANQIELRGYDLDTRSIKQGSTLRVTLYWRALASMNESYRVFVHLITPDNRTAGGTDVIPGRGAFPTVYWKPGDVLRDVVRVPIAANAVPGKYTIEIGLYPAGKPDERMMLASSDEDRVLVDSIKVAPSEALAFKPQTRLNANFADKIELTGYNAVVDQNTIQLALYWRARTAMDRDYTVFVHTLDADGKIVAQVDQQPQVGNYPTSLWDAGENVRDDVVLEMPNGNPAKYKIAIGWYDLNTHERLPVSGGGDHIVLDKTLEVSR